MSRDPYGPAGVSNIGTRSSPRSSRRIGELPTVDRSPSRSYPSSGNRNSPISRKPGRAQGTNSPDQNVGYQSMSGPYYRDEDLGSPTIMMEDRGRSVAASGSHHRSRSATRAPVSGNPMSVRYQSLDRGGAGMTEPGLHDREFLPIREPRERSLDRGALRDRSLDRGMYLEDELYQTSRSARQSPSTHLRDSSGGYLGELTHQNNDLQRELANLKKELELTNQKLGSSMHSIKTFWSPELKKERALRKEESAKYSLITDQLKLLNSENQKQAMLVRQLEEELRHRMRGPTLEIQGQMEVLFAENEHLTREVAILRETIKELELRIETQKQTLQARDESIKKLLEMLQNKGVGKEEERAMLHQIQALAQKQLDEFRAEITRRDQEILAMNAKMKTLEEQHQDYQRHIAVLKESLCAKEEHYNMLQTDLDELRQRLEEKNRVIEKKTQGALQATQDRNRLSAELTELKDHMDIKDRKINVLQRKLELHEANQRIAAGAAKAGEETSVLKLQLDEQKKQLENQRRKLDEHRKGIDTRAKQLEDKEKTIADLELKLKKRKENLDQLESQKGSKSAMDNEAVKQLEEELKAYQLELEKSREDAKRAQVETERLLQLVQMTQEEQNAKEKQIRDLQDALKASQAKLRSYASAGAQMKKDDEFTLPSHLQTDSKETQCITDDCKQQSQRIITLENQVKCLEEALKSHSIEQLEDLLDVVSLKDARIEELEEALKESVQITACRERDLQEEEVRRKRIIEKVNTLEQRLLSIQTARALRCGTCRPLITRLQELEQRLTQLTTERKQHLRELMQMKQEALEAAISEKDAHLALLEMSGIRTAKQAAQAEQLKSDRTRLTQRLKLETENSLFLIQEKHNTCSSYCSTDDEEISIPVPSGLTKLNGDLSTEHTY